MLGGQSAPSSLTFPISFPSYYYVGAHCGDILTFPIPSISSHWYSWMNRKRNCDSLISYSIISNSPFVEGMDKTSYQRWELFPAAFF